MQTIGVIGAGQMGSGIAQTIAQHGLKVLLKMQPYFVLKVQWT